MDKNIPAAFYTMDRGAIVNFQHAGKFQGNGMGIRLVHESRNTARN
ncbi:MAG: hypothetical protein MZV70_66120 [Desulfobacterales bacterium]|nr:hypothetical protein [Desulfobacterales bacterium]